MKTLFLALVAILFWLTLQGCAGRDAELRRRQWLDDVEACMAKSQDFGHDCSLAEPAR